MYQVAVYGTLKRGYGNHVAISHNDGQHLIDTVTAEPYLMLDGGFPMVVRDSHSHPEAAQIRVQVYNVNETAKEWMDRIEGHPNFYERLPTPVLGLDEPVWMYFVPAEYINSNRNALADGLWDPSRIEEAIRDPAA